MAILVSKARAQGVSVVTTLPAEVDRRSQGFRDANQAGDPDEARK